MANQKVNMSKQRIEQNLNAILNLSYEERKRIHRD